MGTIRNRLTIVHDYNLERINKVRESAVEYFKEVVREEWIAQNKEIVQNILVVDFGEGGLDAFVTEY